MVISGLGIGLGVQIPFAALQVVLEWVLKPNLCYKSNLAGRHDDLPTGNGTLLPREEISLPNIITAIVSFFSQLGG
jgi:hypothetical protein